MMKLTDKLFEQMKNSNDTYTIYDANYVILIKTMPCPDDELENYIHRVSCLKKAGVNISEITDYRLIDTPSSINFIGNKKYTKGVFVEKKAPGKTSIPNVTCLIQYNNSYNFYKSINTYLTILNNYIGFLEYKNSAPQKVFDKLVKDYLTLLKAEFEPNIGKNNIFFDSEIGFTFSNPLPHRMRISKRLIPEQLFVIIFETRPYLSSQNTFIASFMTSDLHERYQKVVKELEQKLATALKKYKFTDE